VRLAPATPVARLPAGGLVAVVAPAGPADFDEALAARWLRERGYRLRVYPGVLERRGYLAGSDAVRLRDLHDAFSDPQVDLVLSLRGGYGSPRLLDRIDFDLLRRHSKPFVGYSDLTAIHLGIASKAGFVSFHGPMLTGDLLKGRQAPTEASLLGLVSGQSSNGAVLRHPTAYPLTAVEHGISHGRLTGGNLAIIASLMGTPWEIDTRGAILFIEDVNEPLYRIDRLLNQLRLAGKFSGLLGVLAGDFAGIEREPLDALLHEYFGPLGIPVVSGWRSGHCDPNLTLPLGALVRLDAEARALYLEQDVAV
jgi:muramoyltetrapeptide carboxypeptidase